jgi:four helix bundle protein
LEKPHRKLVAWQKSVDLSVLIYHLTEAFPKTEKMGLVNQMRRCAVSVASNLAEGAARKGRKEMLYFLNIARGSLSELDTQVEVAFRVGFLNESNRTQIEDLMNRVDRLLFGLYKSNEKARREALLEN